MNDIIDERDFAHVGVKTATLRAEDVLASAEFRQLYETLPNVIARRPTCRSSARLTA